MTIKIISNQVEKQIRDAILSALDNGNFKVILQSTDIEIGAVEIKDSVNDYRLTVTSDGRALTSSIVENFPTDYPDYTTHSKLDTINSTIQSLATESTLSSINNKIVICDTGNISGTVSVSNFPTEYPLPSSQQILLKNKLRIMAWNSNTSTYELIEGYEGSKNFTYDSNGNIIQIDLTIILDDGTERVVRRTFTYDTTTGDLTNISRWEVVS